MKYYITSPNPNIIDLWKDDETTVFEAHFVRHVMRLKGDPEEPPFPDQDVPYGINSDKSWLPYFPPFHRIEPYIVETSENRDDIIIRASMYAL
jgi:hypothetical protein